MHNFNGQTCRRLAEAMQRAMMIPEGDEFVFLIGSGNESSNLEALETWVKESLDAFEDDLALAVLPLLLIRLEQTINHWSAV